MNGWLVRDGSNPHNILIEQLGNPRVTISKQRWGIDIRECKGGAFSANEGFDF